MDDKQIDKLIERLALRIDKANVYFLNTIGESIKKIGKLSPSKAQQLVQILKYGGNYEEIVNKISKLTNMNNNEIDKIFDEYAKQDQMFYKEFYEYRNIPFVKYSENEALINQTRALANISKGIMSNYSKTKAIGYSIRDLKGNVVFKGLKDTYNMLIDQALLNVGQGKETFDDGMKRILKDLGNSGLRTLEYESGRSVRLDSAVRMHLKSSLRELHNANQLIIADEIDADGVEISVHENPAPDHSEAQGRQFTREEFDKLQNIGTAKDINGKVIDMHRELKSGETADSFRPISELNCYHYIFAIVLGVNKPEYNDKQLEEINKKNEDGFVMDGKHYTNYQGLQMQRQLERKIREQRDTLALAKASDNKELITETNANINVLKNKYKELSDISGLKPKMKRLRSIQGINKPAIEPTIEIKMEDNEPKVELLPSKFEKTSKIFNHSKQWLDLEDNDNRRIYNGTNSLKIKIYERKNLQRAYYNGYEQAIHTTGVNTDNLASKDATSTLWHELGHSLDNNDFKEYLSNNKDMRVKMLDFYNNNPDVPQKIKDYFTTTKKDIDEKLGKEFNSMFDENKHIEKFINETKDKTGWSNYTMEQLKEYAKNDFDYRRSKYIRLHRYDDMEYAQRAKFSDMFSAISKGKYEWCKSYGYHTKSYYEQSLENPTTELFANFTTLKMTGCKKHLELFKEVAPEIYDELEKVYKEIGVKLNARQINRRVH